VQKKLQLHLTRRGTFVESETAEQISTKLARNVHWMILYQICAFGADLKFKMGLL
jgi:hypothetical protein